MTYYTASGQFVKTQSIDISEFGYGVSYTVSDECSIIKVNLLNGSTLAFQNQRQNNLLVLPHDTLFTPDFLYAIDSSSNFYQLSKTNYISKKIPSLKSTPLHI